jgi:Rieske Fe-S protein
LVHLCYLLLTFRGSAFMFCCIRVSAHALTMQFRCWHCPCIGDRMGATHGLTVFIVFGTCCAALFLRHSTLTDHQLYFGYSSA